MEKGITWSRRQLCFSARISAWKFLSCFLSSSREFRIGTINFSISLWEWWLKQSSNFWCWVKQNLERFKITLHSSKISWGKMNFRWRKFSGGNLKNIKQDKEQIQSNFQHNFLNLFSPCTQKTWCSSDVLYFNSKKLSQYYQWPWAQNNEC